MNKVNDCVNLGNNSKRNVPGHVSLTGGSCRAQGGAYQAPPHTPVRPPAPLEYRRGSQSDHVVNRTTLRSSTLHALWPTYTTASPWPRGEVAAGGSLMNRSLGLISLIMRGQERINLDLHLITDLFSATSQIPFLTLNLALIACEIRRAQAQRWFSHYTLKFLGICLTKH